MRRAAEWVWYARGVAASSIRTALTPLSALFGAVVQARNAQFDRRVAEGVLPAMSIGNLTVGGTGKTPVASWFAQRLHALGASPSIVLRGYGDDEWRVHQLLTPDIPVLRNADRVAAMVQARRDGADCVVLDDAFQHRRAARVSDVVLVSADRFPAAIHLLPAGPFREGFAALQRATAVIVTVKAATPAEIERVEAAIRQVAPELPLARVSLVPGGVRRATPPAAAGVPVSENEMARFDSRWLEKRRLLLTSAIADADAFERQVVARGVHLVRHVRFPDHHDFGDRDIAQLVSESRGTEGVLCTLKDAVKLAPLWPREAAPLWYVSQTLVIDRGAEVLEQECLRVLGARTVTNPTAG